MSDYRHAHFGDIQASTQIPQYWHIPRTAATLNCLWHCLITKKKCIFSVLENLAIMLMGELGSWKGENMHESENVELYWSARIPVCNKALFQ